MLPYCSRERPFASAIAEVVRNLHKQMGYGGDWVGRERRTRGRNRNWRCSAVHESAAQKLAKFARPRRIVGLTHPRRVGSSLLARYRRRLCVVQSDLGQARFKRCVAIVILPVGKSAEARGHEHVLLSE